MNPALLQKGSNSFRTDSEIKDHEGTKNKQSLTIMSTVANSRAQNQCKRYPDWII